MTNGLRNHPSSRKGCLRVYLMVVAATIVGCFALAAIGEAIFVRYG